MADHRNWFAVDIVDQQCRQAQSYVGDTAMMDYRDTLVCSIPIDGDGEYDSPLEVIFKLWWLALQQARPTFSDVDFGLEHQREVLVSDRRYRLDFVVHPGYHGLEICQTHNLSWPLIGIELDGHTFHEKTLDQVTYRNRRDRDLQQAGWKVFHYSYSELTSAPLESVTEVSAYVRRVFNGIAQEIWRREHPTESAAAQQISEGTAARMTESAV